MNLARLLRSGDLSLVLAPGADHAQVDSPRLEKPFKVQEARGVIQPVLAARGVDVF